MSKLHIPKILLNIGLTENDVRLYTTLLETGPSFLSAITKKAELNRTSAYYMLEKLMKKGLVKIVVRPGNRKHYMAEPPETLTKLYERYVEQQAGAKRELRTYVSELKPIYANVSVTPKVRFYQGVEGVKKVMNDALSGKYPEVLNIVALDPVLELLGLEGYGKLIQQHVNNRIRVRVLRVASQMKHHAETSKIDPDPQEQWRERRVLPKSISFTVSSWIYGSTISYFSSKKEGYAMTVESEELATMHRALFEYVNAVGKIHCKISQILKFVTNVFLLVRPHSIVRSRRRKGFSFKNEKCLRGMVDRHSHCDTFRAKGPIKHFITVI